MSATTKYEPESELREVLAHYDLGELVVYVKDTRGYVNTSYTIELRDSSGQKMYFLRKYKIGIGENDLQFEHSVIKHLLTNQFNLIAQIFPTKTGESFVRAYKENGDDQTCEYYAIFEYLKGEDKFTWINPVCSNEEIQNAASVLAHFHAAIYGFTPDGKRTEPKIIELLPSIKTNLEEFSKQTRQTPFAQKLAEDLPLIEKMIGRTLTVLKEQDQGDIVQLVIHCDYHPGNLKFDKSEVIGLFDFDWSKVDARCFDIALAIKYFFSNWEAETDGELRLDDIVTFLQAYQQTLENSSGLSPLNAAELALLPHMISASILYILNWTILDYYQNEVDELEYLGYLQHILNILKWMDDQKNWSNLERTISTL